MNNRKIPIKDRLIKKSVKIDSSGCLLWNGAKDTPGRYGCMSITLSDGTRTTAYVHRLAYSEFIGVIPDGYDVHHKCRNSLCIEPDHLEAITVEEHRKHHKEGKRVTHCVRGHEYNKENTYTDPKGKRSCRLCNNIMNVAYKARLGKPSAVNKVRENPELYRVDKVDNIGEFETGQILNRFSRFILNSPEKYEEFNKVVRVARKLDLEINEILFEAIFNLSRQIVGDEE